MQIRRARSFLLSHHIHACLYLLLLLLLLCYQGSYLELRHTTIEVCHCRRRAGPRHAISHHRSKRLDNRAKPLPRPGFRPPGRRAAVLVVRARPPFQLHQHLGDRRAQPALRAVTAIASAAFPRIAVSTVITRRGAARRREHRFGDGREHRVACLLARQRAQKRKHDFELVGEGRRRRNRCRRSPQTATRRGARR